MDNDEWEVITGLLEHGFKGDWNDAKSKAYWHFLKDFDREAVVSGIDLIAQGGKPFLPAAAEIVAAIKSVAIDPTPGWSEAWRDIQRVMTRATRVSPRRAGVVKAMEWAEANVHEVVRAFVEQEGLERLLLVEFYDPDYGAIRLRELESRWNGFVDVAVARLDRGLALDSGRRAQLGRFRPQLPPAAGELPPAG